MTHQTIGLALSVIIFHMFLKINCTKNFGTTTRTFINKSILITIGQLPLPLLQDGDRACLRQSWAPAHRSSGVSGWGVASRGVEVQGFKGCRLGGEPQCVGASQTQARRGAVGHCTGHWKVKRRAGVD